MRHAFSLATTPISYSYDRYFAELKFCIVFSTILFLPCTTLEMINKIHDIVLNYPKVKQNLVYFKLNFSVDLWKEGRLLEHIMLHYWIDWLTKSWRNGHIWRRKKSFFMITMHHLTHRTLHRQKAWIGFRIASASTVSSRPGPQRLLSVPKPQEMAVWQAFWVERRSWMGNRRAFWCVWQIVLFGRHRKVKKSLDSLYSARMKLHGEIKPTFAKKINSCPFYHVNIKHPSIYL